MSDKRIEANKPSQEGFDLAGCEDTSLTMLEEIELEGIEIDSLPPEIKNNLAKLAKEGDWAVLWRLVFTGHPRITQEITLWIHWKPDQEQRPFRLARIDSYLCPIHSPVNNSWGAEQGVTFSDGVATFEDDYLQYKTKDLRRDFLEKVNKKYSELPASLDETGPLQEPPEFLLTGNHESIPRQGENVRLAATLRLSDKTDNPIFYLKQPKPPPPQDANPVLSLSEIREKDNRRRLAWTISGLFSSGSTSEWRQQDRSWHRVLLRQDQNKRVTIRDKFRYGLHLMLEKLRLHDLFKRARLIQGEVKELEPLPHYFETVVDGVALDEIGLPTGQEDHAFDPAGNDFYIGGFPDKDGVVADRFTGEISYLELDPNDSCGTCAM